jgi:hypothetical protein
MTLEAQASFILRFIRIGKSNPASSIFILIKLRPVIFEVDCHCQRITFAGQDSRKVS